MIAGLWFVLIAVLGWIGGRSTANAWIAFLKWWSNDD